ncbi:MAG: response regulator, partial [Deltaproteobacteria bacterium]|nr:response regulator [Deltaproteobacteria bacterium]
QMPVMNGQQAAMEIRDREKKTGKHIPIIALTAHSFKDDCEKCLESGMDEHVTKPIVIDELYKKIRLVLGAANFAAK